MRKHHVTLIIGLTAGALTAGSLSYAAIPHTKTKQITACYPTTGTDKGRLRVIDSQKGVTCAAGEAKLEWASTGVNWRGNWSAGSIYYANDVVYYKGTSYRAKLGSSGVIPGTDGTKWVYLARAGSPGRLDAPLFSTGERDSGIGLDTSTAIGVDGLAIISHEDTGAGNLRVSHCNDLACTSATTTIVDDPAGTVGTGSSIAIVAATATTTSAVIAIGRCLNTSRIGVVVPLPLVRGATSAKTVMSTTASPATLTNGRRMPPIS